MPGILAEGVHIGKIKGELDCAFEDKFNETFKSSSDRHPPILNFMFT
jgi:hypothetical protein